MEVRGNVRVRVRLQVLHITFAPLLCIIYLEVSTYLRTANLPLCLSCHMCDHSVRVSRIVCTAVSTSPQQGWSGQRLQMPEHHKHLSVTSQATVKTTPTASYYEASTQVEFRTKTTMGLEPGGTRLIDAETPELAG